MLEITEKVEQNSIVIWYNHQLRLARLGILAVVKVEL